MPSLTKRRPYSPTSSLLKIANATAYSDALKLTDDKDTAVGILCEAANLYIEIKRYQSAEKCLKKALSYGKNDNVTGLLINMGVALGNDRNYSEAVRIFEYALNNSQSSELKQLIYNKIFII